jgi:regulatory protein YycH of two-component signal transduction system YycFG
MAEAGRLQPPKLTYIVWMVSDDASTMNMGQIKSSVTLLTKRLKASFETTTPYKPTQIFITAEDDPGYQLPGAQIILTTKRF